MFCAVQYKWIHLVVSFATLPLALSSCKPLEHRKSTKPLNFESAEAAAEIRLPLPRSASAIEFSLSGETQNWRLYVKFNAPTKDTEVTIHKELDQFRKIQPQLKDTQTIHVAIPGSSFPIPQTIFKTAPSWWQPNSLKSAQFSGTMNPLSGPKYWYDPISGVGFYYEHF